MADIVTSWCSAWVYRVNGETLDVHTDTYFVGCVVHCICRSMASLLIRYGMGVLRMRCLIWVNRSRQSCIGVVGSPSHHVGATYRQAGLNYYNRTSMQASSPSLKRCLGTGAIRCVLVSTCPLGDFNYTASLPVPRSCGVSRVVLACHLLRSSVLIVPRLRTTLPGWGWMSQCRQLYCPDSWQVLGLDGL